MNKRKIKFIAYIRNYYIKKDGHRASRKQCPDYYAGFENLCKAMEYNPRMLIGLANKLIPHAKSSGTISISQHIFGAKLFPRESWKEFDGEKYT